MSHDNMYRHFCSYLSFFSFQTLLHMLKILLTCYFPQLIHAELPYSTFTRPLQWTSLFRLDIDCLRVRLYFTVIFRLTFFFWTVHVTPIFSQSPHDNIRAFLEASSVK
jgi:hypothetical protein